MPRYDYKCPTCGMIEEKIHKYNDISYPDPTWIAPTWIAPISTEKMKQPEPIMITESRDSQIRIILLPMGEEQDTIYRNILENSEKFNISRRQASCFVFPNGSFGGTLSRKRTLEDKDKLGIEDYVISKNRDDYRPSPLLQDFFRNCDEDPMYFHNHSCKNYFIVKKELEIAQKRQDDPKDPEVNNAFIFEEFGHTRCR